MTDLFTPEGRYLPVPQRTCTRCSHVLVDVDDAGPYYQVPSTENMGPLYPGGPDTVLTFMDRVHECDGQPHILPAEPTGTGEAK
jgi:hypothetical protein